MTQTDYDVLNNKIPTGKTLNVIYANKTKSINQEVSGSASKTFPFNLYTLPNNILYYFIYIRLTGTISGSNLNGDVYFSLSSGPYGFRHTSGTAINGQHTSQEITSEITGGVFSGNNCYFYANDAGRGNISSAFNYVDGSMPSPEVNVQLSSYSSTGTVNFAFSTKYKLCAVSYL